MAKEKEKGGFFKIFKQFVTGDGNDESGNKKIQEVPENEEELNVLLKKISPESMEKARKNEESSKLNAFESRSPEINSEVASDAQFQIAEVAELIHFMEKMNKPGPDYAYFEYLKSKEGIGPIDIGMEKVILKTILSALTAIPEHKGISAEAIVSDAQRHLGLVREYSAKRLIDLEARAKTGSSTRRNEIIKQTNEINARKRAIESLQKEIADLEKKTLELDGAEKIATSQSMVQLNATKNASEQVISKIEKDIVEIRKYLMPPPTES